MKSLLYVHVTNMSINPTPLVLYITKSYSLDFHISMILHPLCHMSTKLSYVVSDSHTLSIMMDLVINNHKKIQGKNTCKTPFLGGILQSI